MIVTILELRPKAKDMLTGKEGECVLVSFTDKSFENICLSWNSLRQLLRLKASKK